MKAIEDKIFGKAAKWFYDCDNYYTTIYVDFQRIKNVISTDLGQMPIEIGITKTYQAPVFAAAAELDNLLGTDLETKARKRKPHYYDDPSTEETDVPKAAQYIYTSQTDYYVEDEGRDADEPEYYAEVAGFRFRALSKETLTVHQWSHVDTDFLNGTFQVLLQTVEDNGFLSVMDVYHQSNTGAGLDFKNFDYVKRQDSLYLIGDRVYNRNEMGNFVWAYYLEAKGYSGTASGIFAQGGTILQALERKTFRLDESWDREARWNGVKYYYEEQGKLTDFYLKYWLTPKI